MDVWCEMEKLSCVKLRHWLGMEDVVKWSKEIDCNGIDMLKKGDDDSVKNVL